jgi:uncharacterized damage-inducible protein DinB
MTVPAEVLRIHLAYSAWAAERILECTGELATDEWTRDFQTADRSVLGTLSHIYAADRIWLERMKQEPFSGFRRDLNIEELRTERPAVQDGWREWAIALTDESAAAPLHYCDLAGNPYTQPVWQLVLHVVNHATHHRGQAAGFLRAMGHKPPKLDLVYFYRERDAAAAA